MKLKINLQAALATSTNSLAKKSTFVSQGVLDYVSGTVFILLALVCIIFIKRAKLNAENYKKNQLLEYHNQNPKKVYLTYEQTGMYLPTWERAKQFAPVFGVVIFVVLAVVFFLAKPISLI